ncbi:peptidylprolyl isomerase [Desulfospira joergensenii]|uniref:peptidylprolyl isomerase n=1 Tax=Desulfospira joergensenii TaxID=53329 RepID=UPI0003B66A8E|nr:peptidylprolyl isomerase [Desulfospira joergensenii]
MKKIVMSILISLMFLPAAHAKVVAKVGDLEIDDQEVTERMQQLPPQYKTAFASEEGKKQFIDQLVQEKLIYLKAKKEKYDANTQVLKQLDRVKQGLMIRQFMTDTLAGIKASEEELKKYYNENSAEFMGKAQVKAKHILCNTEEEAKAAKERVLKGESFEDVAMDVSTGPSGKKGGDLGWFSKEQMVPEFGNMAFSLEKDGLSDPVKTQFGYHIIKVYDKKSAETKSFEEARADLERKLNNTRQKQYVDEMILELKKEHSVTIY